MPVEIKVAKYEEDIEDLLEKYSSDFNLQLVGVSRKYGLKVPDETGEYSIGVSISESTPDRDWNLIAQISGPEETKVKELMEDLTSKFDINLRKAPEKVRRPFEFIDMLEYADKN